MVDELLHIGAWGGMDFQSLGGMLDDAGSAYLITETGNGLEQRVTPAVRDAVRHTIADAASVVASQCDASYTGSASASGSCLHRGEQYWLPERFRRPNGPALGYQLERPFGHADWGQGWWRPSSRACRQGL
ncbi:hypothetical protein ACFW9N_19770 [Streptomyces sp. NPDC059496]|uniref:hypothetical protein n=1 Tax=Streptomyces sp. NPDC059496 TaxID=3346851 RepID=UPI0036C7F7BD